MPRPSNGRISISPHPATGPKAARRRSTANPRELLAELRDETAAILSDIEALVAELGEPVA